MRSLWFTLLLSACIISSAKAQLNEYADIENVWPETDLSSPLRNAGPIIKNMQCKPAYFTAESPFFISLLQKNYDTGRKITEPLVYTQADGKVASKAVPAFSIIKLLNPKNIWQMTPEQVAQLNVSVEVISLPNEEAIKEMQTNRRLKAAVSVPLAEQGDLGFMRANIMSDVQQFVFKVKDPAILKIFPQLAPILKDTALAFVSENGKFLARDCCPAGSSQNCRKQFAFSVATDANPEQELQRYFDNSPNDELFSSLFPVQKENLAPLAKILTLNNDSQFDFIDFRYFDTRGFVRVPLEAPVNEVQRGPLKTYHYKSDDPNANDAYGHPVSICAFFQAVESFNRECTSPACNVQWGDFYHSARWNTHADHDDGTCIDIRPVRKTEGYGPVSIWGSVKKCTKDAAGVETCKSVSVLNSNYDRTRTQLLVNHLVAAGGVGVAKEDGTIVIPQILFNDSSVKGTRPANGHHNHMHVCFPPASEKVQAACRR